MLPKAWRYVEHDGIYVYKGGTTGASKTSREPYCEYYGSQITGTMCLNAVHYDLENWKGITASKCALFTNIDTAYIPIAVSYTHLWALAKLACALAQTGCPSRCT